MRERQSLRGPCHARARARARVMNLTQVAQDRPRVAGGGGSRRDVTRLAVADARSEDSSASILETLRPPNIVLNNDSSLVRPADTRPRR